MRIISSFLVLFIHSFIFSNEVNLEGFSVNSFQYSENNTNFNKGLRLIATGEYFFNKKMFPKALPYYQEAFSLISNDSSVAFRLGEIYEHEKLWKLATLYYEDAIKLSEKQENFAKSQLLSYIARVRVAKIAYQSGDKEKTRSLITLLRAENSLIQSLYPEAWEEFSSFFDNLLPENAVRTSIPPTKKSNK
ncbi:MAG: tetratricopeptide repeat protein [Brevinema sp.]